MTNGGLFDENGHVEAAEEKPPREGPIRVLVVDDQPVFTEMLRVVLDMEPDIKVEFTEADFESNRDPQLDKAVEVLSQ